MVISAKGRYAITAMMDLAIHDNRGPLTLSDISQSQGISLSYLEQIFARLRKSGLVQGTRGRRGGYRLGKPAEAISMADIIKAVEDRSPVTTEYRNFQSPNYPVSPTRKLWDALNCQISDFLKNIALAEAVAEPEIIGRLQGHENSSRLAMEAR